MGRFVVYSGATAFYVVDTVTGQEACIGDGVDTLFDEEGYARTDLDSQAFVEDLAQDFNSNESEILEAYFPEQYEKEVA